MQQCKRKVMTMEVWQMSVRSSEDAWLTYLPRFGTLRKRHISLLGTALRLARMSRADSKAAPQDIQMLAR